MSKTSLIAAFDIGSGKITAVAAEVDLQNNTIKIVAGKETPCSGLKGGIVGDIRETSAAVIETMNYLEEASNGAMRALYIAVRGEHLESFTNHGTYNISRLDKEITAEDISQVIENARSIPIKSGTEIISAVPQGFFIDHNAVKNPEGMDANLLEVDVHITTGPSAAFNNLAKAIVRPGFRIDGRFYGLICLTEAVLSQEEKNLGAMVIDLGGETTSVGIFVEGALKFSKDISYGSDLITHDIAHALRASWQDVKKIKETYGITFPSFLDDEGDIPVPSLDGRTTTNVKKDFLLDIIQPRVQDIFEQVKEQVNASGFADFAPIGILTGGGSLLPGITEQCCQSLGLKEVRRAIIQPGLVTGDAKFMEPVFSTAVSLALYAAKRDLLEGESRADVGGKSMFSKFLKKLKNSDIFGG